MSGAWLAGKGGFSFAEDLKQHFIGYSYGYQQLSKKRSRMQSNAIGSIVPPPCYAFQAGQGKPTTRFTLLGGECKLP